MGMTRALRLSWLLYGQKVPLAGIKSAAALRPERHLHAVCASNPFPYLGQIRACTPRSLPTETMRCCVAYVCIGT